MDSREDLTMRAHARESSRSTIEVWSFLELIQYMLILILSSNLIISINILEWRLKLICCKLNLIVLLWTMIGTLIRHKKGEAEGRLRKCNINVLDRVCKPYLPTRQKEERARNLEFSFVITRITIKCQINKLFPFCKVLKFHRAPRQLSPDCNVSV